MSDTVAFPVSVPPSPVQMRLKVVCCVMALEVLVSETVFHVPVELLPVPSLLVPVTVHDVAFETSQWTVTVFPERMIFGSAVMTEPPERLLEGGGGAVHRPLLEEQNQPTP